MNNQAFELKRLADEAAGIFSILIMVNERIKSQPQTDPNYELTLMIGSISRSIQSLNIELLNISTATQKVV